MNDIEVIEPGWSVHPRVRAAFTLRYGGVSVGPFASLNLGAHVGDAPRAVAENRLRMRQRLHLPAEPTWLQQIHGTAVVNLDEGGVPGAADAALTRQSGRVCVIQVADCLPVLFAAMDGSAIAAAHAGWRGLAAGVLESTVRSLGMRAEQLCAWIGPGIGPRHFEVGAEVRAAFLAGDLAAEASFEANERGRWQCHLSALARRRLSALGIREISGAEHCTYADPERFFSYRRDGQCGRMAALVWLD